MISYRVKARLGEKNPSGEVRVKEFINNFQNSNDPVYSRRDAYSRYESFLDVIGDTNDPEENLSFHIWNYGEKMPYQVGKVKVDLPTNKEQLGVNLYFILDEDYQDLKKDQEYLIIGDQEERSYLTRAENLVSEMNYFKEKKYKTSGWTIPIKYWNYESNKENEAVETEVLFTPYNFWESWNPDLAEGYI